MSKSLFIYAQVKAQNVPPSGVDVIISSLLEGRIETDPDTGEETIVQEPCYPEVEAVLLPPGKNGSRSFDQKEAIDIILAADLRYGQALLKIMKDKPSVTPRWLWDRLYHVLRKTGFKMQHGRLTGVLEPKTLSKNEEVDEQGQPDID